jgi:drug/metabolite transporter (DMT)-like permease
MPEGDTLLAALLALAAAAGFAAAAVLQQRSASQQPSSQALHLRLLVALARRRMWLISVGIMILAYVAEAAALYFSNVAFVEPLISTELVFALPFAVATQHRRPSIREWLAALAVVAGVGLFLAVAQPHGGTTQPSVEVWILTGVALAGLVLVLLSLASGRLHRWRAALLGACAGTAFATLSLLTKATTAIVGRVGFGVLLHWEPYALIGVGIAGFLYSQSAYQAGPLESSLPVIDSVEPILAVLLGVLTFGEIVPLTPVALAAEAAGGALAASGVIVLGRSALIVGAYAGQDPHGASQEGGT